MQLWTDQQECVPLACRQVWEGVNSFCKQVYYDNKMSKSPFQAYTVTDTNSPLCDCGLIFKNIFLMHVRRPYPQEMCVLGPVFAFLGRFSIPTNPSGSTDVICWDSHSLECYRHQSYEGKKQTAPLWGFIHTAPNTRECASRFEGRAVVFLWVNLERLLINTGS